MSPARAASTSKLLVMTGPTRCPASISSFSAHMAGVGSARKQARNISTNSAVFSSGSVSTSWRSVSAVGERVKRCSLGS
ncbi:hypothetical protein ACZ90_70490 [Streptomyces albus subsp. albus]|nr:hypothetical protein ACZ90_70490 [Streptomyces albus subsp. albus]